LWISGIERYWIMRIMKIPEHPVLHAVELADTTDVEFNPGIQELKRLHTVTIGVIYRGVHIFIGLLQLALT
jgi:hypothetical protein